AASARADTDATAVAVIIRRSARVFTGHSFVRVGVACRSCVCRCCGDVAVERDSWERSHAVRATLWERSHGVKPPFPDVPGPSVAPVPLAHAFGHLGVLPWDHPGRGALRGPRKAAGNGPKA